ncbi:MAG: hypothetical protein A3J47_01845 [Candidatus Yanofskybacteria bacterium RIFCSPHIGHO2_02_FULL_43_22]|uniref:Histidine kinase/HSP90-like ATPase domain-containing protein n=1 Tax=Candidatus Yanofskybacteria bacterium RIFCSPHIGHO2_02_FULL_43_22 TaxID=1802681 RepID=A0A1F8FMX7_9BACT|nr:MAG: hypothetical protein A3J47_01845 [Candidatus Yanofskybacteria bacterium RIFCSPHIGHO2_02_FULL_43_22]
MSPEITPGGPPSPKDSKIEKSRKAEMPTEFGALRRDWFEKQGIDISKLKYSELKKVINEFYEEVGPVIKETLEIDGESLEGELSAIAKQRLDSNKVTEIRKQLNLPKWVSLAETVAFIKSVLDTGNEDIQEKYAQYATEGISLDDMRDTLVYENDVKPARLDTDIYHQSPERSRSAVEIVSNAVDAVNPVSTIGRFGVGFYQILSHLKSDKDFVTVRTGNDESGYYEIGFRLKNKEIQFHLEAIEEEDVQKGTTVELNIEDFPKEEAEKLVKKHFAYNAVAQIVCNGEQVNNLEGFGIDLKEKPIIELTVTDKGYVVKDNGIGMSPQVILEKLLVPKLSGKKPVQEFKNLENIKPSYLIERRTENDQDVPGKIVINVGASL